MAESNFILSASELQRLKKQPATLPPSWGPKDSCPSGTAEEKEEIEGMVREHADVLHEERIIRKGSLSVGIWDPEKCVAEIVTAKGSQWNHFGITIDSKMYVTPEEALFLMEQGSLELIHGGRPLSLQEAFSVLLLKTFSLDHYLVYAYLLRLGFIVIRHRNRSASKSEEEKDSSLVDTVKPVTKTTTDDVPEALLSSPVSSLWKDQSGCQPLVRPSDARSTAAVLSKLQVVKTQRMNSIHLHSCESKHTIAFDVYQPGIHYKKSDPGPPYICICVCRFSEPAPSLADITRLTQEACPTPLKFAVVSGGSVSFYSFLDADVPTFITSG